MSGSWHGGKGDRSRPFNYKKWAEGYERAFGKRKTFFETIDELNKILDETNKPLVERIQDAKDGECIPVTKEEIRELNDER